MVTYPALLNTEQGRIGQGFYTVKNTTDSGTIAAKPFVKWVGGKQAIASEIIKKFPSNVDAYIEPFLGGGGMMFEMIRRFPGLAKFGSDGNFELVTTYQVIKAYPGKLIEKLSTYKEKHCKEFFLEIRDKQEAGDYIDTTARFIYLNKTCFNGLYRVNSKGKFNVSFGSYKSPKICDAENIFNCCFALKNTAIIHSDVFGDWMPDCRRALIYFDPPYDQTFTSYTAEPFSSASQLKLRNQAIALANEGHAVFVSNSRTDYICEIYQGCIFYEIQAPRSVSAKGSTRSRVTELLIEVPPGLTSLDEATRENKQLSLFW